MKTVKIKVRPTQETLQKIPSQLEELTWLWNWCRRVALHNQCLEWYGWAGRKGVDLDGCIRTPLYFGKRSVYTGVACRIAVGGPRWQKDETKTIAYRKLKSGKWVTNKDGTVTLKNPKWEPATKHGTKLVAGDKPYERITPIEHEFIKVGEREVKRVTELDSKARLNAQRACENLPPLTIHSDFIGGMIKDFETSWKAYCDPKLQQRYQPRYKDGKRFKVQSFCNNQQAPKLKINKFVCTGLEVTPCDRSWQKRIDGMIWRSYKLVKRPSGWYLCISCASPAEAEKPILVSRRNKASAAATKGLKTKEEKDAARAASAEYQAALAALKENKLQIEIEQYLNSSCNKPSDITTGIDPGVKAIVSTDHGAVFRPNVSRGRIAIHIEALQSKLGGMREANDRRLKASWRMGKREATKNEAKLAAKISRLHEKGANSSNAFNHKLSTRLVRTYGEIWWEENTLGNMSKGVDPKLAEDGTHYEQNGAAAKTGLNYAIRHACMGDLRAKVEGKSDAARKRFELVPAHGNSQHCHCCGEKGDRAKQDTFFCLNSECELHLIKQQADVNAAKNVRKRGNDITQKEL